MIPKIHNGGEPFLTGIDYSSNTKQYSVNKPEKKSDYISTNNISINPVLLCKYKKNAMNFLVAALVVGVSFSAGFIYACMVNK